MADNEVTIKLSVEGNARVELDKASEAVRGFGKTAEKSTFSAAKAFETFSGVLGAQVFLGAINKAFDGAKKLFDIFVVQGIKAAQVQEDAINELNIALKNSGIYSKSTSQELQKFASELQATTKYGDETILKTQGLIQSLGQLDRDGLKKATKATLDMAAALGIDLNAAALLVGKAAAGEVGSFSRYGLVIKKGATNAETFANVLDSVNSKFGGAAAAQVNTFSGALEQVGNLFGDLQETVGFMVTQNEAVKAAFKAVGQVLLDLQAVVNANKREIGVFIAEAVVYAIEGLRGLIVVVNTTIAVWLELKKAALTAATGVAAVTDVFGISKGKTTEFAESVLETERAIKQVGEGGALMAIDEALVRIGNAAEVGAAKQRVLAETMREVDSEIGEIQTAAAERRVELDEKLVESNAKLAQSVIDESKTEIEKNNEKIAELQKYLGTKVAHEDKALKAIQALHKKNEDLEKAEADKRLKFEQDQFKARLNTASTAFGNLAALSRSKNKELAAIGKASAIAQTTIQTYQGAQLAFSSLAGIPIVGPALGAAAAAAAIVAGLARVAEINGTPLQTGLTSVPGVGTQDNFPAMLAPRERVISAEQNADLTEFLSGQPQQTEALISINEKLDRLQNNVVVNIGGQTLVDELIDAQRGGRTIEVA